MDSFGLIVEQGLYNQGILEKIINVNNNNNISKENQINNNIQFGNNAN